MAIFELCIHLMHPANCAFCRPKPPAPAFAQPAEYGPWITAQFPGECAGNCGAYDIEPGERIRSDGRGGWLCETCGEEQR